LARQQELSSFQQRSIDPAIGRGSTGEPERDGWRRQDRQWIKGRRPMSSVVKKRRKKIRKHKYKKLRARTRIERRKRR
jgi:Mitochondrial domain of unknown function (DUF1713)